MRTQAQSQREVTENLAAALANPHQLPSIVEHASQADDGPDPDPDYPDGDPDGRGSGDGDVPEDPAEPPEDPLIALARAVHALAWSSSHTGDSAPKTKVCKPDTFDGSDNYDHPLWMDDYHKFLQELTTNFGPHDAIVDAIQQLENLTMKDGSQITKYVVEFNHWASQVKDYGVGALCHHFYSRLPDCIKDKITQVRKLSTLAQLHELAQTIDAHYWEHKAEISHTTKSTTNKSQSSSSNNKSKSLSSASAPKSNTKGKGKQKDLPKPDASKSDIAHLLGKDGKLTSAEHQHRMKNNLCLFCGKAGHSAKDCPKSTSHAAKACAATAGTLPPLPAEKAEPKN
ncbi:hypothetical protein M404DRAFT_18730 [Pisolithus tinctorius Marx 270]|uniref:CCHC-type domain-containing protein n=1 Tax=Pisolithus tinctorius Marx 270 TaxID=870435 RepID=A0A0C3PVC2_PISTI|nr:hypothetical protein M404DRAFT_18730 [Pisolithus tinctorius Marx 270]